MQQHLTKQIVLTTIWWRSTHFVLSFSLTKYIMMVVFGKISLEGHCYPPITNIKQCRDNCSNIRKPCISVYCVIFSLIKYVLAYQWFTEVRKVHSCYIPQLSLINDSKGMALLIKLLNHRMFVVPFLYLFESFTFIFVTFSLKFLRIIVKPFIQPILRLILGNIQKPIVICKEKQIKNKYCVQKVIWEMYEKHRIKSSYVHWSIIFNI